MSESKFLRWQDYDGDGLIDVCDDDLLTPEPPCKAPCVPDPFALSIDWKKRGLEKPFLNTKICHFQMGKETRYDSTAPEHLILSEGDPGNIEQEIERSLEAKFREYESEMIDNFLDDCPLGARLNNDETRLIVRKALEYKKYDLPARQHSRLKLLYSVPFDVLYNIADAPDGSEIDEGEEEFGPGWEKVTYNADTIGTNMIRLRKMLHFYGKMLKVSQAIGEGNAYFVDSAGEPTSIFQLHRYGDSTVFDYSSVLCQFVNDLKQYLAARGFALPDSGPYGDPFGPIFMDKVTKIQFSFKDKKLRVMRVWSRECGNKPTVYNKRSGALKSLLRKFSWDDPTAVNYFINLSKMATALNSRVEQPWRTFLEEYTYPPIRVTQMPIEETIGSCLYNNFRDEINEMGNDILDQVFDLSDLVAYLYNDTLCRSKLEEVLKDDEQFNKSAPTDPESPFGKEVAAILAKNQKYKKLTQNDDIVLKMCVNLFNPITNNLQDAMSKMSAGTKKQRGSGAKPTIPPSTATNSMAMPDIGMPSLEGLWKEAFGNLKMCGLLDMMFEAMGCLFQGMTLDAALPNIIEAALKAMSIENYGDLFVGLPPEKQELMDEIVKAKLEEKKRKKAIRRRRGGGEPEEGSILAGLKENGVAGAAANYLDSSGLGEYIEFERPWENEEVIAAERAATDPSKVGDGDTSKAPSQEEIDKQMASGDRTFLSKLDSSRNAGNKIPTGTIMGAYIDALIEVYSDNLIEILDELNRFPGAPLLRDLLSLTPLMCPRPPMFQPGLDDFVKSLDFAFCRKVKEIQIPRWTPPLMLLELKTMWKDMAGAFFRVARFAAGMIVLIVVNQIVAKVCDILSRAICKALEITGDLVTGLPGAISGAGPTLREIIREHICGEDVPEEQLDNTIIQMMSIIALGPSAFADRDKTIAFANDLSLTVTRQEFADALLGNPSEEFVEATDQLLEYVHTDFREALPNRNSIVDFAKGIGNFLPPQYREVLNDFSQGTLGIDTTPANPSICASPEQIQNFKDLRCEILAGRISEKQCEKLFCDLRDESIDDLTQLQDIFDEGFGDYVGKKVPSIISTPGCEDGLLPYETPEMLDATIGYMGSVLDSLEDAYLDDMLGTGFTFFGSGDRNFGFLTMVLSDTKGNNLRNHHRKANNRDAYVNFAANVPNGGTDATGFFASMYNAEKEFGVQQGQYPYYVAEWMKRQFLNAGLSDSARSRELEPGFNKIDAGGNDLQRNFKFESTNKAVREKVFNVDLDSLEVTSVYGQTGRNSFSTFLAPDFGYNTYIKGVDRKPGADFAEGVLDLALVAPMALGNFGLGSLGAIGVEALQGEGSTLEIVRLPRKGDPGNESSLGDKKRFDLNGADINLDFKDNAMGTRKGLGMGTAKGGNEWSYGYEVQCYYSDIEEIPDSSSNKLRNRPDDNIRVQIVEKVNYGADRKFASPMAKKITGEATKLPPFDLPGWIEKVPIVGWALESIIKLILLPFSALTSGMLALSAYIFTNKIQRFRKYEFMAIDAGLDAFAISQETADEKNINKLYIENFPLYAATTINLEHHAPQVRALADILGTNPAAVKNQYDEDMTNFYKDFAKIIGENQSGWLYGASYDFLTEDDMEYGVERDGSFVPYNDAGLEEEDMVLGISRNEFKYGPRAARVKYLDPMIFGGTFSQPNMHLAPMTYDGWWGMVQAFFPDDTGCKPHGKNLINFDEIKEMIEQYYPTLPEDERLYSDIDCVRQVPFDRILTRNAKMNMYTLILAAIRIYASTHLMKSVGTFSAVQPKFPDNFSTIYAAYIVERMEEDFKNAQPAFWESLNTFKDEEFWYAFLEQSVECYDFLVNAGELGLPVNGGYLQRAADTINNLQTHYAYAYRKKDERSYTDEAGQKRVQTVPGLWELKWAGEAGLLETLKAYRERKNLEGVKSVEDEAKTILQQLVNYELTKMGELFVDNMQNHGFNPEIFDLDYWLFENKCVGSTIKYAGPKIIEMPVGLPSKRDPDPAGIGQTFPGPYHTPGGQFRVASDINMDDEFEYGDEYVGYYHIRMDDDGDEIYVAGAVADETAPGDVIVPVADRVQVGTLKKVVERYSAESGIADPTKPVQITEVEVPLGDVPEYGSAGSTTSEKPFKIEKYVSINGTKYNSSEAKNRMGDGKGGVRISDRFPGTLRVVENSQGQPVGIEGQLGVRHGLAFYYNNRMVTSVEVDALDLRISQFQSLQPNSKLLHCLLQKLKHDGVYKLLTSYIFSMKKVLSTLAIYNDMGFLASVGEVTTGKGDNKARLMTSDKDLGKVGDIFSIASTETKSDWMNRTPFGQVQAKPGARIFVAQETEREVVRISEMSDTEKQIYGIPNFYDDDLEFKYRTFDPKRSGMTGNEGWNHPANRPEVTPFTLHWDEWDRVLLRNSRAMIKKLFRIEYYSSSKTPGSSMERQESPAKLKLRNLKARLFPAPGAGLLPWHQKRRVKKGTSDKDGNLCGGPDIIDDNRSGDPNYNT